MMKKNYILLLTFLFNFNFIYSFEYLIKDTSISYSEDCNYVSIKMEYEIKNTSDSTIYMYDINKKNDYHYEEDFFLNDICSKKIYIFKPFSKNDWTGSWGYNPCYPNFIKINSGEQHKGILELKYTIPKEINPNKIFYEFNFIFSNSDISDFISNFDSNEISEKYLSNKAVRFKLKHP